MAKQYNVQGEILEGILENIFDKLCCKTAKELIFNKKYNIQRANRICFRVYCSSYVN